MKFIQGALFGAVLLAFLAGCGSYSTTTETFTAVREPGSVEHGRNLVFNSCGGCHYDPVEMKFTGKQMKDVPGIAGKVYSANLTRSGTNGIPPHYTDAELKYLLRTGIARNGRFIPYMLRPNMNDRDINDVIAYLRSDDAAVAPYNKTVGLTHMNFIGKIGIHLEAHPEPYTAQIAVPPADDDIANGRYLVDVIGCFHCHSGSLASLDYLHPEQSKHYLAGGKKFKMGEGKIVRGANITPDAETGIGNFTKDKFRRAVKEAIGPDGEKLSPPMEAFHHLQDREADQIYAYLMSRPPVHHLIK